MIKEIFSFINFSFCLAALYIYELISIFIEYNIRGIKPSYLNTFDVTLPEVLF